MSLIERIKKLKEERDALILAHFYQPGEIQDLADACGDSYFLAKKGQESTASVILLAGVVFMAESVKILNPTKTVLVPDLKAGCSLVDESPYDKYLAWRRQHPDAIAMTYINSSAEVKSISDVICTSSNAEQIVRTIPQDRPILFGPDKNLGRYLSKKLNREMILWPGACEVHVLFSARKLFELKEEHPDALVIAHPECEDAVLAYADVIGSTSRLLDEVKTNQRTKKFIVATETGIFHQMQKVRPDAQLIQAPALNNCLCNDCPYMKLNSLEKVAMALEKLEPQVNLPTDLIEKARTPLQRMVEITEGRSVQWPSRFEG
jgi:quinolinate synthase